MEYVFSPGCLLHDTGNHPECIARLREFESLPKIEIVPGDEFLSLVHTSNYIDRVKSASEQALPLDADTITSPGSFEAACTAVGASVIAAETGGFALVRPPGHHAYANRASGFCLFNNVAIATRHLTSQGKKVLILDIDGHQGDGTCDIFYNDPRVLFCSLHQYPAFPGTGWLDQVGTAEGTGFTINIPMPAGSADDVFWQSLDFVLPIAKTFNPDVVAVSAGFDAHRLDPLLQLKLSLNCYYQCGAWLRENFNQVFAVLEGGYNLSILPKAIKQFHAGYNKLPAPYADENTKSDPDTLDSYNYNLSQLRQIAKQYWPA
ncbi:MAG: acetylpolyamine amidohydrolase [Cyclobacteriaceae bacterium]|nr:MAG: acetylpolyamine amidohydrolase [Cyclobacteriaceae bacterium]